jgi:hypothetical protein
MEKMNKLLEKYFRGETSLDEEKELKKYFLSGNVKSEHEPYRAMFEAFDLELHEKAETRLERVVFMQHREKHSWIRTLSYAGIAASVVLTLWIQRPQNTDDFAIISGKRIENSEYAQKYAAEKLNKATGILKRSMKPMQSFATVRKTMEPIKNISDTNEK